MPKQAIATAVAENYLLKDAGEYAGKFVATRTFKREEVVSSGNNPVEVYQKAIAQGVDDPVIFYVEGKDTVHVC